MPPGMPLNGNAEQVLVRLDERMRRFEEMLTRIDRHVEENVVTRTEFDPVKRLVFGAAGLILVGVVGALIALVVQGG